MKIPRVKISARLQGILWFCCVIILLILFFTVAFFLTSWIYMFTARTPPVLLVQLINSLGGIFLLGVTISIVAKIFMPRRLEGEMRMFGPIIEALRKIATGDFSVSVDSDLTKLAPERSVIGELVNSVNQMALDLNQMETMRQEFISNVSHEIQSPLTSIRGFAQALHNDDLNADDRHHYLTIIETESIRLSKLSDNLLKLASLETRQVKFEPKLYRLDRQIRNLVVASEPQWQEKALEMEVSLEEVAITADEDLLSQVWINLIHNSIKFTPSGGRVCINLCRGGDKIDFRIADTGVGISAADQAHIFERFYKADKSRTRSQGGSGLGLSIVKKIVELHRGIIGVQSQQGTGTTFTVSLPTDK